MQEVLGENLPVAYALDGYPIYGLNEPDGSKVEKLDEWNGHVGPDGNYHYHSTKTYPYLNGGFYGEVVERNGQVDPQPRAQGVRPYTRPLRGAKITGWQHERDQYSVEYQIGRDVGFVNYTLLDEGRVQFEFIDTNGETKTETYEPGARGHQDRGGADVQEERRAPRGRNREGRQSGGRDRASNEPRLLGSEGRVPWILAHSVEMDTNKDEYLSRSKIEAQIAITLESLDANRDSGISRKEADKRPANRPGGLPMGGFVKQHYHELDKNSDESISSDELSSSFLRMFDKADVDGDGRIGPIDPSLSVRQERPQRNRSDDQAASQLNQAPTAFTAPEPQTSSGTAKIPSAVQPLAPRSSKPNFIVILIDDMGWRGMGFSGSEFIDTPRTDALARQGSYSVRPTPAPLIAPRLGPVSCQASTRHGMASTLSSMLGTSPAFPITRSSQPTATPPSLPNP